MADQFRMQKEPKLSCPGKKLLEIKPLHHHGLNCFEDIAITLLSWMNKRYEIVFADCWGFEFDDNADTHPGLLGDKIGPGKSGILTNIKKYFGLDSQFHEFDDPGNVMAVILSELNNGTPVLIAIDTYWCPWHGQYLKLHQQHYCLAIGVDNDSGVYCIDPILNTSVSLLPHDLLWKSSRACATFTMSGNITPVNCYEKLRAAVAGLFDKQCFINIRKFAERFGEKFDFGEEFKNLETSTWNVLLHKNISFIAGGRMLFALFLKFLSAQTEDEKLTAYSDDLVKSSSKWNIINGILMKAFYTGFNREKKQAIVEQLKKIAGWEEQIAEALLYFDENKTRGCRPGQSTFNNQTTHQDKNIIFLDLDRYFNNTGFAKDLHGESGANFTGTGVFFLSQGLPENRIWSVASMKFKFPEIAANKMDNIVCGRQEINSLPAHVYDRIMFLGNAEYGNFFEDLCIQYSNNKSEIIPLRFPDWAHPPMFGEVVAWEGSAARRKKDTVDLLKGYIVRIFAVEYFIKEKAAIKKIILPDCSHIHIFAISLVE